MEQNCLKTRTKTSIDSHLSAIRGEILERERGKEKKRERERKIVLGYYTGYLSTIVKIKREIKRKRDRGKKRERERERRERDCVREIETEREI